MQNRLIAHQVLVQRFGSKLARDFLPVLQKLQKQLARRIRQEGSRIATKRDLSALTADTREIIKNAFAGYDARTQKELIRFVEEELEFNSTTFKRVDHTTPKADAVLRDVENNPMVLNNEAVTIAQASQNLTTTTVNRINRAIQGGLYQGLTNDEIVSNITGSLNTTKNQAQTVVRTTTNFIANAARQRFYRENANIVEGYVYVATLDSRTSDICRSLDGREVKWTDSYQPVPPEHPNCRSTTRPLLREEFRGLDDGATRASKGEEGGQQVDQNLTYYEWLKRQPAAFQDEALGPTRGKIFRNAGLTPEEFRKASVNRFNEPLTLDEMKAKSQKIDEYLT